MIYKLEIDLHYFVNLNIKTSEKRIFLQKNILKFSEFAGDFFDDVQSVEVFNLFIGREVVAQIQSQD